LDTGEVCELPVPEFTLHPKGTRALTVDFHRLEDMRPGYGYYGSSDPNFNVLAPANADIWMMDLEGGEPELLVLLAEIAAIPRPWHDLILVSRSAIRATRASCFCTAGDFRAKAFRRGP